MKIVRMTGLLITALLCNSMQSMELPSQYPLEEQLLNGEISFAQYWSILEKTSQYGLMLRDLRTADYGDEEDIYMDFVGRMQGEVQQMQEIVASREGMAKQEDFEYFLENLYQLRKIIPSLHKRLMDLVMENRAWVPRALGG